MKCTGTQVRNISLRGFELKMDDLRNLTDIRNSKFPVDHQKSVVGERDVSWRFYPSQDSYTNSILYETIITP
jgi:hypothetical protein